jgi:hypothetical protein
MKILNLLPQLSWWITSKIVRKDAKLIKALANNYSFNDIRAQLFNYNDEGVWENRHTILLINTQITLEKKARRYNIIYTIFLFIIPQVVLHSIGFTLKLIITLV